MLALKEFADFVTLNMANLATTFSRLLAEQSPDYAAISPDSRTAIGRKLLNAVVEACREQASDPLISLFKENTQQTPRRWPANITPPKPLTEVECLGQTLTPVVTNLEAGKFLWQMLSEIRADLSNSFPFPVKPVETKANKPAAHSSLLPAKNKGIGLLETLADSLPDIIFIKDTNGRFLFVNDALRRQLGAATVEDVIGKTDYDFNPKELADQYRANDERVMKSGKPLIGYEEPFFNNQTNTHGWFSTTKILFEDEQGNVAGIMGLIRDITELKTAQLTLTTRIRELNCLNELGRQIEEAPDPADLLEWTTTRLPAAMQHPDLCQVAITFDDAVYGSAEAIEIPSQMTHGLYIEGQVQGRVYVAYTKKHDFLNEESALLGAVATRISVFLENQKLFNDMQTALADARTLANEQTVLAELGQALTARLNVEQVLEEAYKQTSRLVDTTNFYIGLYNKEIHQITFAFDVTESEIDKSFTVISADEGLAGHIVRNGTPLLFKDNVVTHHESLGISVVGQEPESWLGVPLMTGDEVLGVMAVQSYTTPRLYSEHSQDLLMTVGSQVAIALQNARLFEEIETTLVETKSLVQEQSVLNELGQDLTARLSVEEVVEAVYKETTRLIDTTNFYVGLYNEEAFQISFPLMVSESEVDRGITTISADQGLAGYIIKHQAGLLFKDNVREQQEALGVKMVGQEPKSWLGVPVIAGENILGVIAVQSYTTSGLFTERDRDLLTAVANQAAVAIQNARQFEETQAALSANEAALVKMQQAQREAQILQQLAQTLTGSLQTKEVINAFFNAARQLLGIDFSVFSLVDTQQRRVKAVDGYNVTDDHIKRANHALDSDDIMADIIRTGQTEIIRGANDPRFDQENIEAEGQADWGLRIFTPITVRQENIGLVEVGFREDVDVEIEETQVQLLKTLTDQVAISLDNAQRYQASQQTAHREQTIREITDKMRTASSLEELVKTTAQELGQRFSAEYTLIDLGIHSESGLPNEQNGQNST